MPNTVVLVPLKGANNIPTKLAVKEKLNEIYGQAVAEWEVEIDNVFDPAEGDSDKFAKIETGDGGLLSNYASEMREINGAYKNYKTNYNKSTYYIFLAGESEKAGISGYMLRAKNFGYVFTNSQTTEGVIKTIAHELGHGAFHLEHTFEETAGSGQKHHR